MEGRIKVEAGGAVNGSRRVKQAQADLRNPIMEIDF